jgi:putative transposase
MKRAGAFFQLVYHFTWSTRDRLPLITPAVEDRLYAYIGYKCKELDYRLHAVNGTEDHVHVLVSLTPSQLVADVAKNLKGASSHYINKESGLDVSLYWQDGYGVVSLRETEIPKVVMYIKNQKEHHRDKKLSDLLERIQE